MKFPYSDGNFFRSLSSKSDQAKIYPQFVTLSTVYRRLFRRLAAHARPTLRRLSSLVVARLAQSVTFIFSREKLVERITPKREYR
ncbi:MAG TPA: hypothetical protein VIT21_05355, partial [Chthoniobacterales bacterium]